MLRSGSLAVIAVGCLTYCVLSPSQVVDVAAGFADVLACKDADEILNVKKAAMLGAKVGSTCKGQSATYACHEHCITGVDRVSV